LIINVQAIILPTRNTLKVSLGKYNLTPGESVKIYGKTTGSVVFLYSYSVFKHISKLPSETESFSTREDYLIRVVDGKFEDTLIVCNGAKPGTYKLYVFAPKLIQHRIAVQLYS